MKLLLPERNLITITNMKILFINPKITVDKSLFLKKYRSSFFERLLCLTFQIFYRKKGTSLIIEDRYFYLMNKGVKSFWIPGLSLPLLAALTPKRFSVEIVDENVSEIDFETDADLIALTAITPSAPRAYEIAQIFRRQKKKTVMEGIMPHSFLKRLPIMLTLL